MTEKKNKIHFVNQDQTFEFSAGKTLNEDGKDGSILQIALKNGVDIDHACGGVGACSTCHVIVVKGYDDCEEADYDELDQLDNAPGLKMESRLACQCVPIGNHSISVEIPSWNRNRVPSDH